MNSQSRRKGIPDAKNDSSVDVSLRACASHAIEKRQNSCSFMSSQASARTPKGGSVTHASTLPGASVGSTSRQSPRNRLIRPSSLVQVGFIGSPSRHHVYLNPKSRLKLVGHVQG